MNLAFPLRPTLLGVLFGFGLSAQAAPREPVAISFDTTPRAGQHQRQSVDLLATMKMRLEAAPEATDEQRAKIAQTAERMSQTGAMKMAMQMQQTMKVDAADAEGWLPLTFAMDSKGGQVEVGGKTVPLPSNKALDMRFEARFNPKDFAVDVKKFDGPSPDVNDTLLKQGSAMISEALQLSKALAQHPLKVGESVDVPLAINLPIPMPSGAGAMQGTVHYKLVRVDKGVAYFDLGMDMKMTAGVPLPAKPDAAASAASAASAPDAPAATPPTLHMAVNGSGKGTSSLRLADNLQLASRLAMDMKMTMDGPDNTRMLMDMDMTVLSKGESLAKPVIAKAPLKKKS
ncbi:hypothetical protein ACG04R_09090 [Roseateles sp. BYS78W]|uniref:DUF2125 domain-containing protein n=1 Tax=Pelomonas candidula TaxID=3299025 RepID=A0ABW7HA91_9BURK